MKSGESGPQLIIDRTFDAPRELVWEAWTVPELTKQWKCPKGLVNTVLEMDVRPGGAWRQCMQAEDGAQYWRSGEYRRVEELQCLEFTYVTDDPNGARGHETLVLIEFEDLGGQTKVTLRQTGFDTAGSRDAHQWGWTSSLAKLAEHLDRPGRSKSAES